MPVDRELLEAQKELVAHTFGQAQAYTNVILVVGYAGFFAIWTQFGPQMTRPTWFWSGLLITLSIAGFIAWEVYGVIVRSQAMLSLARVVNNPARYEELMRAHLASQHSRAIQTGRAWLVALPFIAGTGFLALAIVLSAFVHGLWGAYDVL